MVLLIDNFDSFTHNLADYVRQCGAEVTVVRNNAPLPDPGSGAFQSVILSPGPQTPRLAGHLMSIVEGYVHRLPVLGVCLGHQALGEYFGAALVRAAYPMHGKVSQVVRESDPLFEGLPRAFGV
ncbi:MAG TPA: aminodeoxychorismate/anthranilate synthase component II, partial [Cytophagales bacterium]